MNNLNQVTVTGILTRNVDLRYTPTGTAIAEIGLAINEEYQGKKKTIYIDIIAFAKIAENAGKYLTKGAHILLTGKLQFDEWTDKETNQRRNKIRLLANNILFLSKNNNEECTTIVEDDDDIDREIPF